MAQMTIEKAVNIAVGCVLASEMDEETRFAVIDKLRELETKNEEGEA